MTALAWDQAGERSFETGVDKGVLYLPNGNVLPWNGIISISEKVTGNEISPLYYDGIKYGDAFSPGDFAATLRAYTYPEEFLEAEGTVDAGNGLFVTNQRPQRFGLSYRTKIGNDEDDQYAYRIHVVYNLMALPSQKTYESIGESAKTLAFEWNLTAIPEKIPGFRPTAHLILDTRFMGPLVLKDLEETLYGNSVKDPKLPPISTLVSFISGWVIIRIIDNFDGTWTLSAPDSYITQYNDDPTQFQVTLANAIYLDEHTYAVTDLTY